MNWSPAQLKAIEETGQNILVSAGAGSGKTAVLTERIYRLVKKGHDISKFLVLTFTNAAAAEMKNRVREKIAKDIEIAHLASQVENAHIQTFDGFALFLVKKYAYKLGISKDINIANQSILLIKKQKIIEEIFKEYYAKNDETFNRLILTFSYKNDDDVKSLITKLSFLAEKELNKYQFLYDFLDNFYSDEKVEEMLDKKYKNNKEYLLKTLDLFDAHLDNTVDLDNLHAAIEPIIEANNYASQRSLLANLKFPQIPRGCSDSVKAVRKAIKNYFNDHVTGDFGEKIDILQHYSEIKPLIALMVNITIRVEEEIDAFNKEHNTYDFSDIANMANTLLHEHEDVKEEMKSTFDFIMVDEYQDTSAIQEDVVKALSENNAYMVGDVKQSIYRFRNANCTIFQNKYNAYKKGLGGLEIDLNTSFRSRKEIVDAVNDIFSSCMRKEFNEIDYSNGHYFGFGNISYNQTIDPNDSDYKLKIYTYEGDRASEKQLKEAQLIADDIVYRMNHHSQVVLDLGKNLTRDVTFKDFAIIISNTSHFDIVKEALASKNIPVKILHDESIKDNEVTMVVKNLVKLYYFTEINDFNNEFKHAFTSVARSFLVGMKDQEIYDVFKNNDFKETEIIKKISSLIQDKNNHNSYQILNSLYKAFEIYDKVINIGYFAANTHKGENFLLLAKSLDELGYTFKEFVDYFDDLATYELEEKYNDNDVSDDAVNVLTIHTSKGLEYPICYFPYLFNNFNRQDSKGQYLLSNGYGIIFDKYPGFAFNSLAANLLKKEYNDEDFMEKLRLFYVAITRAKERAILFLDKSENYAPPFDIKDAASFKDILCYLECSQKYMQDYVMHNEELIVKQKELSLKEIKLKKINVEPILYKEKQASKVADLDVDRELLKFGSDLHYLLEVTDFKNKDISFIKDKRMQKYVLNVITCQLFNNLENAKIYHEYKFYDEINGTKGIIDLLIVYPDHIDIIDFKMKNLSDDKYLDQLHIYRDYIKTISHLKINLYLLAALTGEVKSID